MQLQGEFADYLLMQFRNSSSRDKAYVARLKRHYQMVKEEAKNRDLLKSILKQKVHEKPEDTIQRNDPCLCGSGKKYKKCCLV